MLNTILKLFINLKYDNIIIIMDMKPKIQGFDIL